MHRKKVVTHACGVVGSVAASILSSGSISTQMQRQKKDNMGQTKSKKRNLSGGELNPGLLRVVLSNDKQKY
jgi:hypothetical protein